MARVEIGAVAIRLCCIVGLFPVACLAFAHTRSELAFAEASRQEKDLKAIFQSFDSGGGVDARSATEVRARLSSNALDSQALAKVWVTSAGQEGGLLIPALLSTAGQVSRRSTSYLAAELMTAAGTDDVSRVVRAIDRMASLNPRARASLNKLAVPLLDVPNAERAIARLNTRPWFAQFIKSAVRQPERLDQVVKTLDLAQVSDPQSRAQLLEVVTNGFLEQNNVAGAQAFAASFGNMHNVDFNSFDFNVSMGVLNNTLLTWQFPNPAAQPLLEPDGDLLFQIRSSIGPQPLAEKFFVFAPGRHRVEAKLEFTGMKGDSLISWTVSCGRVNILQASRRIIEIDRRRERLSLDFMTTEACTGYRISLYFREPNDQFNEQIFRISAPVHLLER